LTDTEGVGVALETRPYSTDGPVINPGRLRGMAMLDKENQAIKFIEKWTKEKIELLTYINDCVKKVLGDKNDKEETFCLFTNIEFLYGPVPQDEFDDDRTEDERNKFIDYSNKDSSTVKETELKVITRRCETIKSWLKLVPRDIVKDDINSSILINFEKEINSLVIYASLLLASYHSHIRRTQQSTNAKRGKRNNFKYQVWQAYVHTINDFKTATAKKILSENKMAKLIQERIGMKEDGKTPKIGLSRIKTLLKEECLEKNIIPPWIK